MTGSCFIRGKGFESSSDLQERTLPQRLAAELAENRVPHAAVTKIGLFYDLGGPPCFLSSGRPPYQ
jgi:hypothetical protein